MAQQLQAIHARWASGDAAGAYGEILPISKRHRGNCQVLHLLAPIERRRGDLSAAREALERADRKIGLDLPDGARACWDASATTPSTGRGH